MKKIVTVVGARPQFVKAAAVSRAVSKAPIREVIVHTGQHFDKNMSDIFFEDMQIPEPDYNLEINGVGHGAMTGRMLEGIEQILLTEKPDFLLVYGDTNSTIAGALAAKKLNIPVVHVEAGLRSYNMAMPEEINRILTDRISDILFCPTQTAVDNLRREGFDNFSNRIVLSGDVMQDAALYYADFSEARSQIIAQQKLVTGNFILATIHRQENTDNTDNLKAIIAAMNQLNSRCKIVVPIHPRTRKIIEREQISIEFSLIDPVGYFDMIELLKHCKLVMTDSGGLQKEAFFFKKQCITMRDQTEWVELVEHSFNRLTGADTERILSAYEEALTQQSDFDINLYGNGSASERIVSILLGE